MLIFVFKDKIVCAFSKA